MEKIPLAGKQMRYSKVTVCGKQKNLYPWEPPVDIE
jgi:hypothetical protein